LQGVIGPPRERENIGLVSLDLKFAPMMLRYQLVHLSDKSPGCCATIKVRIPDNQDEKVVAVLVS
jgi:hypothetical protein